MSFNAGIKDPRPHIRARTCATSLVALTAITLALFTQSVASAASNGSSSGATKCADPSGKVNLGVSYFSNSASVASQAIGADTSNVPADQAIVDNLKTGVSQLNSAGGLAGCEVDLVTYRYPASTSDWGQQSQQECTAFTQDTKVFAVFSAGSYENKVGVDCFAKAKLPFFASGGKYQPTCDDLKKYAPYLYYVNGVASCRYNQLITLWNKAGLFAKDAKVGILAADDGTGQGAYVANKVYGPALKKLKIPYEVASYHQTTSSADLSNTTVTWSAAILKFKSDGVNTVIFTPGGATGSVFPSIANGQAFYPAYGLTTSDALNIAGTIGAAGLKTKAIAVSWAITDLPLQAQQALPTNSAITDCAKWTAPSPTTVTGVSGYCDFVNILQASLGKAKDVKPATLRKGIDALGTKFKASVTYNGDLQFGAKVNGGNISEVQMLQFDPATKTFGQIPGTKPVPLAGT